jgi:hypothetical protein
MREQEFSDAVHKYAGMSAGVRRFIMGIREEAHFMTYEEMELDSATVLKAGDHYIPYLQDTRGTGKLQGVSIDYSYLDVRVSIVGEAKRDHNNWILESMGVRTADLALEVHASVNGHPYRDGTSDSAEASSVRLAISYNNFHSVSVYAALVVKQTGDIYKDFQYTGNDRTTAPRDYHVLP